MTHPQDDRSLHQQLDDALDALREAYRQVEDAALHDSPPDFDWTESEALTNSLHLEIQRLRDLIDGLDTLQPPGAM